MSGITYDICDITINKSGYYAAVPMEHSKKVNCLVKLFDERKRSDYEFI